MTLKSHHYIKWWCIIALALSFEKNDTLTQSVVFSTFPPVPVHVNVEQDILTCRFGWWGGTNTSVTLVVTFSRSSCLLPSASDAFCVLAERVMKEDINTSLSLPGSVH